MTKQYVFVLIAGLVLGSLIVLGMFLLSKNGDAQPAPIIRRDPLPNITPGLTSIPEKFPLIPGVNTNLRIYLVNASGDETIGEDAEQDLTTVGYTVYEYEEADYIRTGSLLKHKPDKAKEILICDALACKADIGIELSLDAAFDPSVDNIPCKYDSSR